MKSSDGAGYVYKLAPDLRVSVGLDKSFTMNTNPKDPAHAIIVVGVPPLDRDQEEKSKMKTPTANNDADRLLAASDPQASSGDARRLLDAFTYLIDDLEDDEAAERLTGVAYAIGDKLDAALAAIEAPSPETPRRPSAPKPRRRRKAK